jgi:DNA-directed DNA polymerase III PolC
MQAGFGGGGGAGEARRVLHLDADAFFASVEQAADRRLRGRPVAVGGERRGVVASASYEARRLGVRTAMPTALARKLCPALVVVPGDFEKYERFSRFVFSYAYDFTPVVEISSIDEGYADLTGQRKKGVFEVAAAIRRAVRQSLRITLSEGVGTNKLVAAVASKLRKPDALVGVPPGGERAFLDPLEAKWLPGVGPKMAEILRRAGLVRIGQVALTPPGQLALFAGAGAVTLRNMALGIDPRPVVPDPPAAKSLGEQETFAADTADEAFVRAKLRQMADRLLAKLRGEGRCARILEVRLRYNDFDETRRSESFPEPTDLEADAYPAIDRLVRRAWERRVSIRLAGVKFSNLYGGAFQDTLDLWGGTGPPQSPGRATVMDAEAAPGVGGASRGRRRALAEAVDRLREDAGPSAILRGHDLYLRGGVADGPRRACLPYRGPAGRRGRMVLPSLAMRSCYSFLDSLLTPEAAARLAAERGCRVAAIADPNLHGAVEFALAAKEAGIRPVVAAEVMPAGRRMLAYVRDATGYRNLCALLSDPRRAQSTDGLILVPAETFPEVRYSVPAEHPMFQILQSIRTLTLLGERDGGKHRGAFHFRKAAVTEDAARLVERIVEECGFEIPLGVLNFPRYAPPDGLTPRAFLGRLALEGLRARYGGASARHEAQLREELGIIAEVGYEEYFLVVWDILEECRREGIAWITRGSAADSLVCYCLGISDVCPIRYKLYFKRFLNRERMALAKLPDIDIDFAHDRRDAVVDRIFAKYGEQAAVVGGFSTYRGRSAFADIAKVFGVSERQIRRYTEHLPHTSAAGVARAAATSIECAGLDFGEDPYATALQLAERLDGFPRHPKMHPCGIVLARRPVHTVCPVFASNAGRPTTHFDMEAVEAAGLVKMDILAQGGLAVMRDTLARISHKPSAAACGRQAGFGAARLPDTFDDPSVWAMIASGGARGVHHIESPAMISLGRMVNVRAIDDLIAIVSVIRPGAANTMRKASFARRAQGLEPIAYAHPCLEPILDSTYGVVAYEEHILQICEAFAGMSAGRADRLRRALVKNRAGEAEGFFEEFAAGAGACGRGEGATADVWRLVTGFKGYAFCRAHSTAYGIEAYQAAWLKRYHPAEFMAAVLTHGKGFHDRLTYSIECRQLGIGFLHPDINASDDRYAVVRSPGEPPRIRVPLWQIKGLSELLLARWRAGKPFASIADFIARVRPAAPEAGTLVRAGAFDCFGQTRTEQFWQAREILAGVGEEPLFAGSRGGLPPAAAPGIRLEEPPPLERLRDEMDLLGFTVGDHPLALFPGTAWHTYCPVAGLPQHAGCRVRVAGMVVTERHHRQSDGRPMKFLSLCDPTGIAECELFASACARFATESIRHPVIEITATVRPFDNGNGFSLDVHRIRAARTQPPPPQAAGQGGMAPA